MSSANATYSPSKDGAQVRCLGSESTTTRVVDSPAEPLLANLTFGIKHFSGVLERRELLVSLLSSIRERYPTAPILVAYDGNHTYEVSGPHGERYIHLTGQQGVSAGRNAIASNTKTEYLMVMDDDVLFDEHTRVGVLVAHLKADVSLALVAG